MLGKEMLEEDSGKDMRKVVRTGLVGAAGKMGRQLVSLLNSAEALTLTAAIEQPGHPSIGTDAGALAGVGKTGVSIGDDLSSVLPELDVLIDFTIAEATARHLDLCRQTGTSMVIGTTGMSDADQARLHAAGADIGIVFSSNYSLGINTLFKLVETAAAMLGDAVDIEIIDTHHRHKVDAPSGTALTLGDRIAKTLGRQLKDSAVFGRHGITEERKRESIGFHAVRAGDTVGEHRVIFAGVGEQLEISHRAHTRANFAEGALQATRWISSQPAGVYDMLDVLGIA